MQVINADDGNQRTRMRPATRRAGEDEAEERSAAGVVVALANWPTGTATVTRPCVIVVQFMALLRGARWKGSWR